MRLLRWLGTGVAALLVLAVAAAWFAPDFLDWNRYRGQIASVAAAALGERVRIGGDIALTLLPEPVLTASDVSVASPGRGATLSARRLRMRVALGPLLAGRIDAQDLVLQQPELVLPWPVAFRPALANPPPWLAGLHARIEEGELRIGALRLTRISAEAVTDADTGTLTVNGTAALQGQAWRVRLRLSRPGADGSAALDLALDGQDKAAGTVAVFSGQVAADGSLQGHVAGHGPSLALIAPAPSLPWSADGRLTASGGMAIAGDLALTLAGAPATGAVALRLTPPARLDLALATSRLDLDAWGPVLLATMPNPLGLPTGLDLSAEAATLAGGTLTRLRAGFELSPDGFTLRDTSAILPGDAALRLSGGLTREAGGPRFTGTASLQAADLRPLLRWLASNGAPGAVDLPPGALRQAALSAQLSVRPGRFAATGLHGRLDGQSVTGGFALQSGAQPMVSASIALQRLDLDPWLPQALPPLAGLPGRLGGLDLDVQLRAEAARWHGIALSNLVLDGRAGAGRIALRRLDARLGDMVVTASGAIAPAGDLADARLHLAGPDASVLQPLFPEAWRAWPAIWQGPVALDVQAAGPPKALGLRIGLDVADAQLGAQPVLDLQTGSWAGLVTLRHPGAPRLLGLFGIPGAASWLGEGSFALTAQLSAHAGEISADRLDLTAGALHAAGRLALISSESGPVLSGQIHAATLPLPLPDLRAAEPVPLIEALSELRGPGVSLNLEADQVLGNLVPLLRHAAAKLTVQDRTLRIADLTAALGGGRLTGGLTLNAAPAPASLAMQARLAGAAISGPVLGLAFDLSGGTLDGTVSLRAEGHSPAAMLATLSGEVSAEARQGSVSGFDLGGIDAALANPAASGTADRIGAALRGGNTPFGTLALHAGIAQGGLTLADTSLTGDRGAAGLSGGADLQSGQMDLRLALHPDVPGTPPIGLLLSGTPGQPRRVPQLAALARWLAERPAAPAQP